MQKLFLILLTCSLWIGCKSSSPASQNLDEKILAVTGPGYTITKNQSATFALCTKPTDVSLSFSIVRLSDFKIVVQESIAKGTVTWTNDLKLQVSSVPGIIKKDETGNEYTRIIDLSTFVLHEN